MTYSGKGIAGSGHCQFNIGLVRLSDFSDLLARARVDSGKATAADRVDKLAIDEELRELDWRIADQFGHFGECWLKANERR